MLAPLRGHLDGSGFQGTLDETPPPPPAPVRRRRGGTRPEGFLTSLAGVLLKDAGPARLERPAAVETSGPIFAVLGDPEELTMNWLIRRRRGNDSGVAFLVEPREKAVERLTE